MELKYSVLMSVYEKEKPKYFQLALESMINQTAKPDEIVIVQDGPLPKELFDTVWGYAESYPELIRIIVSKKNIGLGLALNLGLLYCRNELVARMDTDDISLADRCEKQLAIFHEYSDIDIVGGDISEFFGEENSIIAYRRVPVDDNKIKALMKKKCPLNHVSVMFKKEAVLKAGGYQNLFLNEDYYLWIRMAENGSIMANTGTVLVNVRIGSEMYKRRGGKRYFNSEYFLQKYMYDKKLISLNEYIFNISIRFVVQIILPSRIRGWIFKKFAREKIE
jgi:glycosyltransferase involved in cell wall biosynthesis